MAPKKKSKSKRVQNPLQDSLSPIRFNAKKSLPSEEETEEEEYLRYLTKYFEEDSLQKKEQTSNQQVAFQNVNRNQENDLGIKGQEAQNECVACLQSDFAEGKYVLACRHVLCNQCFIYWSAIESQCPSCLKPSPSVLMVMNHSSRVSHIAPKYFQEACQQCQSKNNQEQMYYCDLCERRCIHVYCCPLLLREERKEKWQCKQCRERRPDKQKNSKEEKKTRSDDGEFADLERQESGRSSYNLRSRHSEKRGLRGQNPGGCKSGQQFQSRCFQESKK